MEELRLQAYEAQKQGTTNTYVSACSLANSLFNIVDCRLLICYVGGFNWGKYVEYIWNYKPFH